MDNEEYRYEELADFLKTRRARMMPDQVGLPLGIRRRTPGLRREEVAQLAGIGLTWYTWLEQGRHIQVSSQIIESLARVLQLNKQERIHLYRMANQPIPPEIPEYKGVSPIHQHVLDSLTFCPSFIADQRWNAIAWNNAACCVLGDFYAMTERQRNVVWAMFAQEYYKKLYIDWELHAKSLLGRFRLSCGKYIEDEWMNRLVEDLKQESAEFNLWWPLHEITDDGGVYKQLDHPTAGMLYFESSCFDIPDNSGFKLFVHVPVPDTDTADRMKALLNGC